MRRGFLLVQQRGRSLKYFSTKPLQDQHKHAAQRSVAGLYQDLESKQIRRIPEVQSKLRDIYYQLNDYYYSADGAKVPEPAWRQTARKFFLALCVAGGITGLWVYLGPNIKINGKPGGGIERLLGSEFGDTWEEYNKDGHKVTNLKEKEGKGLPDEKVTFATVIGCDEAKEDLGDIVEFLKNPKKFEEMGLAMPRGVLMVGPPGCGKTLLARALAGEAGVSVLVTDGSSFDQVFVGLGSSRIRGLFKKAREIAPCVIFIDELDALGSRREYFSSTRGTLNQLLVEMDGFVQNKGIVVVAATNLPDKLDPALVRPGRLDRSVHVTLPNKNERKKLFELYTQKYKDRSEINMEVLAAQTTGMSGADIKSVVNMAGVEAIKKAQKKVVMKDFINAIEVRWMGRENKSLIFTPEVKRGVAFHEAGHALTALYTKGSNPVYKATIIPRGPSLGTTSFTPKEQLEYSVSKEEMLADLDISLGGRVAEELFFGMDKITGGASSDFQKASRTAFQMVAKLGMSPKIGPIVWDEKQYEMLSPEMKDLITHEQKALLDASLARVRDLLKRKTKELTAVAEALVAQETLTLPEIQKIVNFNETEKEPAANTSASPFTFDPQPTATKPTQPTLTPTPTVLPGSVVVVSG